MGKKNIIATLKMEAIVYDDDTMDDRLQYKGTLECLADIFLTLAKSEPEYRAALIAACHQLMMEEGMGLEEFVETAIAKMN